MGKFDYQQQQILFKIKIHFFNNSKWGKRKILHCKRSSPMKKIDQKSECS